MKKDIYNKNDQQAQGHIQGSHSDPKSDLAKRLADCIGDEPVASFARRAGIGESTLRNIIKNSAAPRSDYSAKIAEAAGVTVDWLITGKGIKSAEELRRLAHAQQDDASQEELDDFARRYGRRLEKVEILLRMMPEAERERSLTEFLARVQELKEAHDLRKAVAELREALQNSA